MQRRFSVPDEQVRDAADQFEAARKLLAARPPGSGVLLPTLNCAAMAIELYLKSLGAETVYGGDPFREAVRVYARPGVFSHDYRRLYESLPEDIRRELATAFLNHESTHLGGPFQDLLARCEGLLEASRYPFEQGKDLQGIGYTAFMELSDFLAGFVASLDPRTIILPCEGP